MYVLKSIISKTKSEYWPDKDRNIRENTPNISSPNIKKKILKEQYFSVTTAFVCWKTHVILLGHYYGKLNFRPDLAYNHRENRQEKVLVDYPQGNLFVFQRALLKAHTLGILIARVTIAEGGNKQKTKQHIKKKPSKCTKVYLKNNDLI